MTITVTEAFENREMTEKALGERSYRRTFWASTDDPRYEALDVRTATGVPRIGDVYYSYRGLTDTAAYCTEVRARQRPESPYEWVVECDYSTRMDLHGSAGAGGGNSGSGGEGAGAEAKIENPLLRPAEIRWGTNKVNKVAVTDNDGNALANSAGDPFDPPPEKEEIRLTLHITRNEASFDPAKLIKFVGRVNQYTILGLSARRIKCTGISSERHFESGIYFSRTSYDFEIKAGDDESWDVSVLDAGFNRLDGGERRPILVMGRPPASPQLLDGAGAVLAVGGDPVYRTFKIYPEAAFSELGLF